jgi:NAD(P)-dependent dehydrogenase (short-subunit alcohol dehydrogenase family)
MAYDAFNLSGKVALVTGGNSGIGLGMAEALAMAGAHVCIWGSNPAKNMAAQKRLREHGTEVRALQVDVGDEQAVDDAMARTVEALGRVDACFANAGVGGMAPSFVDMTSDEWRRVLRINLDGAFYTLRAAARHMVERGEGGSLVATSSLAAIEGQPKGEHYAATKGALISMVRALAVELARHRIRANAILPGWIHTPMTAAVLESEAFETKVKKRVPMRRWGTADDFGPVAVYLASDASGYHTGDTLVIDGGYSIF